MVFTGANQYAKLDTRLPRYAQRGYYTQRAPHHSCDRDRYSGNIVSRHTSMAAVGVHRWDNVCLLLVWFTILMLNGPLRGAERRAVQSPPRRLEPGPQRHVEIWALLSNGIAFSRPYPAVGDQRHHLGTSAIHPDPDLRTVQSVTAHLPPPIAIVPNR